ncbi:MAG: GAF domain-containing sensor histidine kinase [Chloroflexota bacterium]
MAGLIVMDAGVIALPATFRIGGWSVDASILKLGLHIAVWAVFMVFATLLTVRILRRTSRFYTAVSYWSLVLLSTVLGAGLIFAGNLLIGNILCLTGTLLAAYVIAMPRLPSIGHLMRRGFSFLVYALLAIVLYTICLVAAQIILRNRSDLSPAVAGLAMAAFLVFIFNPILGRVQTNVNEWLGATYKDPTQMLRQYSQSITNILDLQLLATVAVGTASEFLEVQRGLLFLVEHEKEGDGKGFFQLRGVRGMGEINPEPSVLSDDSPLVAFFRYEYRPLTRAELEYQPRFREIAPAERTWLDNLGMEVLVPVYAKNDWIGLLALGPRASGAEYSEQDLALLSTIADQTAVALENTRLVEGLVRLNNDFRRAYTALDQANRHLERLDRTKSDFISIASHELRTPLTLISGSSQMLLDDPSLNDNSYYRQLLSKIYNGTVRLHEIVDSMLDMAKIDTRALELETQPISLDELIRAVFVELKQASTDRKQTVEIKDLEELPNIAADMEALRKVFHHLIINAVKYTPDGGKITISGHLVEPNLTDLPRGGIEVVVSDTGIGIDPRYHELIFAKFYQTGELALHSTGKTKFKGGGPGLGLAIARGIVEAHHGRIWVESPGYDEVNCPGSQFHVVLPLRQTEGIQAERAAAFQNQAS